MKQKTKIAPFIDSVITFIVADIKNSIYRMMSAKKQDNREQKKEI